MTELLKWFLNWISQGDNIWIAILIGGAITTIIYTGSEALVKIIRELKRK
jgi:hypothetical protein